MEGTTFDLSAGASAPLVLPPIPCVTLLWHPNVERIGERFPVVDWPAGEGVKLSRSTPLFYPPGVDGASGRALEHRSVSRKALVLLPENDGLRIECPRRHKGLEIDGRPVDETHRVSRDDLERGLVLLLSRRIVLFLQLAISETVPEPCEGLVGESSGMLAVRRAVEATARDSRPVLIRGATGTGKELVARAIHHSSARSRKELVTLNVAALAGDHAGVELFGSERGAFTGVERRDGYFQRAHGGTLFLDEIGDAADGVQTSLLRVLETGEVQRSGARRPEKVDVRIVTATDADLEQSVETGAFRRSLYQRLAGHVIRIPPLRDRREDLGRLLLHFLRHELRKAGAEKRLQTPRGSGDSWLPASLVARLAHHAWPGNVRELQSTVQRLVATHSRQKNVEATVEDLLAGELVPISRDTRPPEARDTRRADLTDDEIRDALRREQWRLDAAARRLGASSTSLRRRIEQSKNLRTPQQIPLEEIRDAYRRFGTDRASMAEHLEVSTKALEGLLKRLEDRD